MPYFRVDDKLHDHRKTRHARKGARPRDAAAMGLWVLAGSWCMANRTDGFVPADELDRWDTDGEDLAARLVAAGLWHEGERDGENGYVFHEWSDWQESVAYQDERRHRAANRMRRKRAQERAQSTSDLRKQDVRANTSGTSNEVLEKFPGEQPNPTNKTPSSTGVDGSQFDEFWKAYPRKVGKAAARKAYDRAMKSTDHATILTAVEAAKRTDQWTREDGKYVPHPTTWLNQGRWDDELAPEAPTDDGPQYRGAQVECDNPDPHDKHLWDNGRDKFLCWGGA